MIEHVKASVQTSQSSIGSERSPELAHFAHIDPRPSKVQVLQVPVVTHEFNERGEVPDGP
jgi:hypothetical protein